MNTDMIASSSPTKQHSESVTKMDTSMTDVEMIPTDETPVNDVEELSTETKAAGKRKRGSKKPTETDEPNISNARPRRTLPKREETPSTSTVIASNRLSKTKAQHNSAEQAAVDADDEQERDKNIPILHDVADVVWVKMGGHPWWPSLIIRDPNDPTQCFTKITGNSRPKRMYFVVFYGSTADFAWVPDSAVIPYQGVEAFTKYAQESVDQATTKSQKEQLTERFQLKVTISRREDWEMAVRDADESIKQTSEKRLEDIEPKLQFYTVKLGTSKNQSNRKSKVKSEESSEPISAAASSIDPNDPSLVVEKAFEFKSDEEDDDNDNDDDDDNSSTDASSVRKTPAVKIKLKKQTSNDGDTPPAKRRYVRKSNVPNETSSIVGQTANGSSVSYEPRISTNETSLVNGNNTVKKRGRPRLSKPLVITNNEENESVSTTTTKKKSITKPKAFMNKSQPISSLNNILIGQHHCFESRIGFLSPFEEQEIFDTIDQLRSNKTFEEVEQLARVRFEQILCVNLNKTNVDIPQEWFYSFLFAHPILIVKNSHWFNEKKSSDSITNIDFLNDVNRIQSSNNLQTLKHQLGILSKLYRKELQIRQSNKKEETI